jgi:hypothetical protein
MIDSHAVAALVSQRFPQISFNPDSLEDLGGDWLVPIGWIGVCGVLVDKIDGAISVFGSGLPIETWRAAYKLGFRHDLQRLTITAVMDLGASVELLSALGVREPGVDSRPARFATPDELARHLRRAPAVFENQRLWMGYPALLGRGDTPLPFEFRVERSDSHARVALARVVPDSGALRWLVANPERIGLVARALAERRIELVVTAELSRLAMSPTGESGLIPWERFDRLPRREVSLGSNRAYGTATPDDVVQDLVAAGWADLVLSSRAAAERPHSISTAMFEQMLRGKDLPGGQA